MTNEKIEALRDKLNNLIKANASYDEIYEVSKQIDEHIVACYKENTNLRTD